MKKLWLIHQPTLTKFYTEGAIAKSEIIIFWDAVDVVYDVYLLNFFSKKSNKKQYIYINYWWFEIVTLHTIFTLFFFS